MKYKLISTSDKIKFVQNKEIILILQFLILLYYFFKTGVKIKSKANFYSQLKLEKSFTLYIYIIILSVTEHFEPFVNFLNIKL